MSGSLDLRRPAPAGHGLDLADQLQLLRRRWRLIAGCTAGVVLAAMALIASQQASFTATGNLLYDPAAAVVPGGPLAPVDDQQNEDAVTASQTAVIASLPVARAVADGLGLAASKRFNPALRRLPWPLRLRRPQAAAPDAVALAVRAALAAAVVPGSRVIAVSFTGADPAQAAAAANLAMQLYLAHERDQSFATLTAAQTWLESNEAGVQTRLDATEAQLARARAAAGIVAGAQASLTTETASRLAASVVEAQADLAMNQARLSVAANGDAAAANAAIAPNLLPLRKEQADLAAQVQSLSGQYGADYPDLVAARRQLAAISDEIGAETGRELDAAQAEVAADKAQIATLTAALAAARGQSETEDADAAPVRALEQRADAGRDMLHGMTLQADQLAQAASLIQPDARIISAASPPTAPDAAHRTMILAAALALGACCGFLLAGLVEALDCSIRTGPALGEVSALACLALLPAVRDPKNAHRLAPVSVFSEQLRAIRAGLALGVADGGHQVLAITAARPGEGKTTLTIALARALAAAGLRVVAVDGDTRQPRFAAVFGLPAGLGLTDHLAGLATLDEVLQADPQSPLTVIGAGNQARMALSLFLSPAMPDCLAALRDRYDVVLVDVPPAFALAEGRVLARLADGALLCVRWGHTPKRVVAAAVLLLQQAGVNLVGAALTRVDAAAHGRSGFADAEIYQDRYAGYFR